MTTLNKQVYNNLTENSASASASGTNVQKLDIDIGMAIGCPITTNQKISSKVVSATKNMAQTVVDMKGEIANSLKQAADAKLESVSGAGSTNVGSKTDVSTKMNQSITNVVDKTITTKNMSETIASSVNIQGSKLKIGVIKCIDGVGGLDMTQDITSDLAATAVTDALTKALMADSFINEIAQEQSTESKVENRGPLESAGAMLSGIFGAMTYIYALCACVCCVAIAAGLYFAYTTVQSNAGQNAVRVGAQAVAAKMNPLAAAGSMAGAVAGGKA